MNGSYKLGRLAGIDVNIHWTFFLLIAWVAGSALWSGGSIATAGVNVFLIACVFACVVAHEYGHALTARRYGIPTLDITLLPIGGVARLREMPERPWQEFVVAIAGPAVNVVIATLLGLVWLIVGQPEGPLEVLHPSGGVASFLQTLIGINIALVVFNLIPAFPMDGGRMLRALLAMNLSRVRATDIAASVGQALAIGLGFLGLFGNPFLILIALFVFFGARAEAAQVRSTALLGDLPVRAAMIARFRRAEQTDPVSDLRESLLEGAQQDFPVMDGNRPTGIIYRQDVIDAMTSGMSHSSIASMMTPVEEVSTEPSESLRIAMQKMQAGNRAALLVISNGDLVGLLTRENIAELLIFRETDPEYLPHSFTGHQPWWYDRDRSGTHQALG